VLLAVLVVSNVAAALIAEQTRQWNSQSGGLPLSGVLKIYSQMVLIIGGSALLIALPLSGS